MLWLFFYLYFIVFSCSSCSWRTCRGDILLLGGHVSQDEYYLWVMITTCDSSSYSFYYLAMLDWFWSRLLVFCSCNTWGNTWVTLIRAVVFELIWDEFEFDHCWIHISCSNWECFEPRFTTRSFGVINFWFLIFLQWVSCDFI